jgi:sec-independent protein translocase protein TatA
MLSIPDMALLGAAALIFFGPEQLPKVARKVGLLVRDVQNTSQTFIREMERAAEEGDPAGHDVSRAHLLDEVPHPYVAPPEHDPAVYGAYDGGSVAAPHALDVPVDEVTRTVPVVTPHEIASPHEVATPAAPLAGHEPAP